MKAKWHRLLGGWVGTVAAAVLGLAAALPASAAEFGIPTDGRDLVRLKDGRVLRCRFGKEEAGKVSLEFPSGTVTVARDRVEEVRYFADYDSTPRNDEEKEKVARGLVRWEGRWIARARADAQLEEDAARRRKAEEEDEAHSVWENRWIEETEHFRIEANINRENLDFYAGLLENFYDFFSRAFKVKLTAREKKKKLPVFLFRRRDEFRAFHDKDTGGKSEHLLGYFVPAIGQERLVFFDMPGNRQETVDVMFHEGTHFIIHLAEPQVLVNRWVHEGCAEYFGASGYDGRKFTPGLVQDDRLLHFQGMLASGRDLAMDDLIKGGLPAAQGEHVEFTGEHYAKAWCLVHFLMEGKKGKYRNGFIGYLGKHLDGRGVKYTPVGEQKFIDFEETRTQLLRSLGLKDFSRLEEELREYVKELPLRSASAYVSRGQQRLFRDQDPAAAQKDFDRALEIGAKDPGVLSYLGYVYGFLPGKEAESNDLYKRALDLDPLDVRNRRRYAMSLTDADTLKELRLCADIEPENPFVIGELATLLYRLGVQDKIRASTGDDIAAAREALVHAEKAAAMDPNDDILYTLSGLYLTLGEFEKAAEAARTTVELDPESLHYQWRLAQAYALLGRSEDFAKILRRIEHLLRRDQMADPNATAPRDPAEAMERVEAEMAGLVRRIVERCLSWERKNEAALAIGSWYDRRKPKTEEDWVFYATVVHMKGDVVRAGRIARKGMRDFPDSYSLKTFVEDADAAGADGPGGGDGGGDAPASTPGPEEKPDGGSGEE